MARPPSPVPLQRVHIQLSTPDSDLFKELGSGSLSAGVRRAAQILRSTDACPDNVAVQAHAKVETPLPPNPDKTADVDVVGADPSPTPSVNTLDIPLVRPQDPLPVVVDDGPMDLGDMTPEAIMRALAENRADAERAEQKQRHYDAAAQGKTAFVAPKGAHDGDDDPYVYNPEDYPAHLR